MRFYTRKRRQPPAIIIVALIDILIVLLIFLMVTTTFNQQPAVKLALPESTTARKSGASDSPPLVISIDPQGNLRFGPEAKAVTPDALRVELARAVAKDPDLKLAISADKAAPWGMMVKVMDVAKQARIKDHLISAFTKEAGKP
jgi:biopolymer transport protein ExbD